MIPRVVHKSPRIYLTAEENHGKTQQRDSHEGYATNHRLKWSPLPSNEVGMITQHVGKEETMKRRDG